MDTFEKIASDLEQVSDRRSKLRDELRQLDEREARLRTALDVLREYGEQPAGNGTTPEPIKRPGLNLHEAARIALDRLGVPQSTPTLAERMLAMGYPYDNDVDTLATSLRGVFARDVRSDDPTFVRVDRGVYGLRGRDEDGERDMFQEKE